MALLALSSYSRPAVREVSAGSKSITTGFGAVSTPVTPSSFAPPCLINRSVARAAAIGASMRSTPRSKRRDASEESLCRRLERAITFALKCAASITIRVVLSEISLCAPPITPATESAPLSSAITKSCGSSSRWV